MSEAIGQQLRQAREEKSLDLEEISRATFIRVRYLEALEASDFSTLPSKVQVRGFLRSYAGYLGLDQDAILEQLDRDQEVPFVESEEPAEEPQIVDLPPSAPALTSLRQVGERLREQRERLGLSLDDIERHTHLRVHYLQALEAGDLANLPSPVQGRGMLNNYADFLGLDPEPLLLKFADVLQAQLEARRAAEKPQPARPEQTRPRLRLPRTMQRVFSIEILTVVFLIVALGVFIVWGALRILGMRPDDLQGTVEAPSIADVLLAEPTATHTPTPPPPTPTPPLLQTQTETPVGVLAFTPDVVEDGTGVQVYITVRQRTWMRVTIDGDVTFDGRVLPGSAYQFDGQESVGILTGNGAGLQVFYNQQDLGPMGLLGQIIHRVYTLDGVQTPTPTITLTPTRTPRITATPAP
jgi:cytoskeletal protein RodZ